VFGAIRIAERGNAMELGIWLGFDMSGRVEPLRLRLRSRGKK